MRGERKDDANPEGFKHVPGPEGVRNRQLRSKVTRFVKEPLPSRALKAWDEHHVKKVMSLVHGEAKLLQPRICHRRGQIPQKTSVGLHVCGDPNIAPVPVPSRNSVAFLEPALWGEGLELRNTGPVPDPIQQGRVPREGRPAQVQEAEHVLARHDSLHEVSPRATVGPLGNHPFSSNVDHVESHPVFHL